MENRQRKFELELGRLKIETGRAVQALRQEWPREVEEVGVVLVSPRFSGQVHGQFCGDPSPTDVITFPWGEIAVCPAVAERQRAVTGLGLHEEVLTYICHGLLHLCGEEDTSEAGFLRMVRRQDGLRQVALGRRRKLNNG